MRVYEGNQRTLGAIIEDQADKIGDRVFAIYKDEKFTYTEVNQRANQVANYISSLGISKGSKVSVMLPNCPQFLYTLFGLAKIGVVEVPINTNTKGDRLKYFLNQSNSEILIIDIQFIDRIEDIQADLLHVRQVIIVGDKEDSLTWLKLEDKPFDRIFSSPTTIPSAHVSPFDLQRIQYTSGTTGPSKGAMCTHEMMVAVAEVTVRQINQTADDIQYLNVPLFHAAGIMCQLLPTMLTGSKIVLVGWFSASKFWDDIRGCKATIYYYTGSMQTVIYGLPEKPDDCDNPIRVAIGAAMPAQITREFEKRFKLKVIEGYGMSEAPWIVFTPMEGGKVGSVGKPTTGFEVMIVDDNDLEVPTGKVGEIVVRPQYNPYRIFEGYYNMPEETAKSMRHCWFHTGDRGYMDDEGFLHFFDRKKDAIRRRGENISSFELECIVRTHPSVAECAAIAVPSELTEDDVKLVIQLKEGAKLTHKEMLLFCETRMDYFMVPRYIEFMESLPKTPTERIEKYKLRQNWNTANTWDREKEGYKLKR